MRLLPVALSCSLSILYIEPCVLARQFGPWSVDYRHPVMDTAPPWNEPEGSAESKTPNAEALVNTQPPHEQSSFFVVFFKIWSAILTKIDGPRCSHQPTCSAFTRKALATEGLILGFWISLQRLMRGAGSSSIRTLPVGTSPGRVFYLDVLDDYEFWRKDYFPWSGLKK